MKLIISVTSLFLFTSFLFSQSTLAFPSAEGFGQYASGGREGEVYIVTNLNDSGKGSLRSGIIKKQKRTIVFAISGTIFLQSPLDINNGNLTILGQTAPGDGITIANYPVTIKSDNVIVRYMRFRMGDVSKVEGDALGGRNANNIMIDHCSISWSTDENLSFYRNKNLTVQWSIVSEALNKSVHQKGAHGYGGIWGGEPASFHHNLIMSNNSRNPRFSGSASTTNPEDEMVDFRNNVIFNWGDNNIYGGEKGKYNIVNNYYKPGPASRHKNRLLNPSIPYGKFYVNGNFIEGSPDVSTNNWNGGVQCDNPSEAKSEKEFSANNVQTQTPKDAYQEVIAHAGASFVRDAVDNRLINYIKNGYPTTTNGIIDSQNQVGGWPDLKSLPALVDTDKDGMPDDWELKNNLNVGVNDAAAYTLSKTYTNLEIYAETLLKGKNELYSSKHKNYDFVIAKDGTGDFSSVQDAILALPDYSKIVVKVLIKNGVYKEKIILPSSKTNITFIGEDQNKTILTYDNFASKLNTIGQEIGTSGSASFFIYGDNFSAENITFSNTAGEVGQAVAVRIDADKSSFKNCRFLGDQDTLYLVKGGTKQYFYNCYIEGTVDYIFGAATAFFENCELYNKNKGYITAASTPQDQTYGFVFLNSKISGNNIASHHLGRPWRPFAKTVFINTQMDQSIKTEGWNNWGKTENETTTYYAEYNTTGKGASTNRVKWSKTLTAQNLQLYSKENVLGDWQIN